MRQLGTFSHGNTNSQLYPNKESPPLLPHASMQATKCFICSIHVSNQTNRLNHPCEQSDKPVETSM
eukprot:scaffold140600_cov18-Tisochrysis_lutea.AAC.1